MPASSPPCLKRMTSARYLLFYEQFYAYIARESKLFDNKIIRTSDLSDEQLWMLDEGHCFRDQLVRFCQMKAAQASNT